jgi:hypothetical protein
LVGHAEWEAWARASLGWTLLDAQAPDVALEHLERGLDAARQSNSISPLTRCVALAAWARAMTEDLAEASVLATEANELLAGIRTPPGRAWLFGAHAHVATARAWVALGEPDRVEPMLAPVRAAAEASGWLETVACASLVIGQARIARGDASGAEDALRRALAVADGAGLPAPGWEAHAALAKLLADAGREAEAAESAGTAREILERLAVPLSDAELRAGLLARVPPVS